MPDAIAAAAVTHLRVAARPAFRPAGLPSPGPASGRVDFSSRRPPAARTARRDPAAPVGVPSAPVH